MRLVLAFAFLAGSMFAGDWLRFRGPNGAGVSDTISLPVQFGPTQNVVWKTKVPFGRSSPIVAGDRVFLTAGEGEKLITLALDRSSGKILWRREIVRPRHMAIYKGNDAASPTPVSDGTNVYVFFAELGLVSYGPDGNERWRLAMGPFHSFYGMGASPILAGSTLLMVCDQRGSPFLAAVDARTGKLRWKTDRANLLEGFSTPVVYTPEGGKPQVLVLGSGTLDAYALDTGQRLWWVEQVGYFPKGGPVLGENMVYVSAPRSSESALPPAQVMFKKFDANGDGRIQLDEMRSDAYLTEHFGWVDANRDGVIDEREYNLIRAVGSAAGGGLTAVRLGGAGNLTATNVAWQFTKSYPNIPAPLLYRGVLYSIKTGGIITALDPATGEVLKAGRTEKAMEEYFSSPVAGDGKLFLVSESGKVSVVGAGAAWEVLAVNDLDEECWATPAIADGKLYVRTRGMLYSFAESAGKARPAR